MWPPGAPTLAILILGVPVLAFVALRLVINSYVIAGSEKKALARIEKLLSAGFNITSDPLGEFIKSPLLIPGIVDGYIEHIEKLGTLKKKYPERKISLAVKPSRLGLEIDRVIFQSYADRITEAAQKNNIYVWLDAEKKSMQKLTSDAVIFLKLGGLNNVGIALQSVHTSSLGFLRELAEMNIPVRIVKGAYPDGDLISPNDIDANFMKLFYEAAPLYSHKPLNFIAVGTHDSALHAQISFEKTMLLRREVSVEYQLLYGVRANLQEELRESGANILIYAPWGTFKNALGYFTRRLREGIKPNALSMFAKNIRESYGFRKKYRL